MIGVDSGWEIYVAGNGGIKTEVAQFLVKLKTAEEVLEYSGAFLQLYREEGWYLERTVHYVNRVGLDYVKKKILDDAAGRKALWERLQFSLDGEPDPWFEFDKAQVDLRQFDPAASGCGRERMRTSMSDWMPICRVDDIPVLGCAPRAREQRRRRGACSATPTTRCSRCSTAARTRAAR